MPSVELWSLEQLIKASPHRLQNWETRPQLSWKQVAFTTVSPSLVTVLIHIDHTLLGLQGRTEQLYRLLSSYSVQWVPRPGDANPQMPPRLTFFLSSRDSWPSQSSGLPPSSSSVFPAIPAIHPDHPHSRTLLPPTLLWSLKTAWLLCPGGRGCWNAGLPLASSWGRGTWGMDLRWFVEGILPPGA